MITPLYPGTCFEVYVEACFGVEQQQQQQQQQLNDSSMNDVVVSEVAATVKVMTWTHAPPAKTR